jgi:hypothetical protein
MFGTVLEIAIGMVFIYLILSLMVTTLRELLAQLTGARAWVLVRGIGALLNETGRVPGELTNAFYEHPLIKALSGRGSRPSYIPSETFTMVLLDLVTNGRDSVEYKRIESFNKLLGAVGDSALGNRLINDDLRKQLQILLDTAGNLADARFLIEKWFDNTMERVSGWYKRRTQLVVIVCSLVIVLISNADSIMLVNTLSTNAEVRSLLVAGAEAYVRENPNPPIDTTSNTDAATMSDSEFQQRLEDLLALGKRASAYNIIGWCIHLEPEIADPCATDPRRLPAPGDLGAILSKIGGLLMTALLISLGAPFWFDILQKIIKLRGTGTTPVVTDEQPASTPAAKQGN